MKDERGVNKREDDANIYYDIKLPGIEGTSVKTKMENGYLTITGEVEKSRDLENGAKARSFYRSSFIRSFPLPKNAIGEKMEMTGEKNKLVLKFPKRKP
ncbi:MAG: Hsp20/alpha crystallin family protein [Bdellovibrionota bacterium]